MTGFESCDRCGVRALVTVRHGTSQLALCGHDYEQLAHALTEAAWGIIRDERLATSRAAR